MNKTYVTPTSLTFILSTSEEPCLSLDYRTHFLSLIKNAASSHSKVLYSTLFTRNVFKPYTFSVSFGKNVKIHNDHVVFGSLGPKQEDEQQCNKLLLKIKSVNSSLTVALCNFLKKGHHLSVCRKGFTVEEIRIFKPQKITSSEAAFRTLSPVLVRSTNNKKHYLLPPCLGFEKGDRDFSEQLLYNLTTLAKQFFNGEYVRSNNTEFIPLSLRRVVVQHRMRSTLLKIPSFTGLFKLKGDPKLLTMVNYIGMGSRRAQGFGMVEAVSL